MATSSLICGDLSPKENSSPSYPLSHTPICPLVTHPGALSVGTRPESRPYGFSHRYRYSEDPYFHDWNASIGKRERGAEGLKMGTWIELPEKDPIEADEVGFYIDMGRGPVALLPDELAGEMKDW
jgi:hypothetical protein